MIIFIVQGPHNLLFTPVWNGEVSVDTFFFMSGLLQCYLTMKAGIQDIDCSS